MEPKSPSLESAPGGAPRQPEFQPGSPERSEQLPEFGTERAGESARHEQASTPQSVGPVPISIPLPQPIAQEPATDPAASDDNPVNAADEDLIEKEWVDKAKRIIAETRNDPHKREQEVGRLQADYLKKRYGKQLGASE